jgi:hypothetical protein
MVNPLGHWLLDLPSQVQRYQYFIGWLRGLSIGINVLMPKTVLANLFRLLHILYI